MVNYNGPAFIRWPFLFNIFIKIFIKIFCSSGINCIFIVQLKPTTMANTITFKTSDLNNFTSRLRKLGYEDYSSAFDPYEQVTVYVMTNSQDGNKYTGSAVDVREDGKASFYAMNGRPGVIHPTIQL